jgi:uncharacterized YccA/Bax inhibitor family protein
MANPALNEKRFQQARDELDPGWAAAHAAAGVEQLGNVAPPDVRAGAMTANGTFAKTFVLFLLVLAGGAFGWAQADVSPANEIQIPGWAWIALVGAFALAMVCVFLPKTARVVAPLYAVTEGVFLGVLSKAFESQWDGIVFQAILATIGVFFVTLALYVFEIVKVTRKFQMVVIGATGGILVMYVLGALLSLFGVDAVFWNEPSALGIVVSVVIAVVAALNLFLDYEFIRQASAEGAPKRMEWYGAFGIVVTLVWLYIEMLRLISLLRS